MHESMQRLEVQLTSTVYGQTDVVRQLLVGLLAGGHVLLQGVPGVGKTRLARALTLSIGLSYRRIQFTPDLMPSDIIGNAVYNLGRGEFEVQRGPVFANVILADEVNRTPPKTQSALLEAMEERQVSLYGETIDLPSPFFVIATQNPIEYEGTYPLPEAQLDRFLMQLVVDYPDMESELEILRQHRKSGVEIKADDLTPVATVTEILNAMEEVQTVTASPEVLQYIANLVRTSRTLEIIALGASPRAATALLDCSRAAAYLDNRSYVVPDDVLSVVWPVFRHRLLVHPNAQLEGVTADDAVRKVVESVEVPR